jgi:DNA repair exonuclease SbcCD nuclease subunit
MKLAIITDTHIGIRNDSPIFFENSVSFFRDVFFPYCKNQNINEVLHLGDFVDRRKYININILAETRKKILAPMKDQGIHMDLILGNHDCYFKNTNTINTPKEIFACFDNVNVIEAPVIKDYDGYCIGMMPWITKENVEESKRFIKDAACRTLAGHFEIDGREVLRGIRHEGGMPSSLFKKYDMVMSGHFHIRSYEDNISYFGTPYQLYMSDLNEQKGFHVLDTSTGEIEFVENPRQMFRQYIYDDTGKNKESILSADYTEAKNCFVKIFVKQKRHQSVLDQMMEKLYNIGVYGITIAEDSHEEESTDTNVDLSQDTFSLIGTEIDNMELSQDKTKLKSLIKDIYIESQHR